MSSRSLLFFFLFIICNKSRKPAKTTDCQNKSSCRLTGYDIIKSPAVPPPLLVPLSVSVPHSLPLSLAARPTTLAFTLPLTLTTAAHHRLRPPQEVVHTHVVVMLHDGKKKNRREGRSQILPNTNIH